MAREFFAVKASRVNKLLAHRRLGLLDPDISDILVDINNRCRDLVTTSSCSGRVTVIYSDKGFRDKRSARILAKWHEPRECRIEVCRFSYLSSHGPFTYWVSLQPPILHVIASNIEAAESIVRCASSSGLSRVGYKMSRLAGFHVEAGFHDKLHLLLPVGCDILITLCEELSLYKNKFYRFLKCVLETCIGGGKG